MMAERLSEAQIQALIASELPDLNGQFQGHRTGCQCAVHRDEPCPNAAVYVIEAHATDECKGDGVNEFGNWVIFMCHECATQMVIKICMDVASRGLHAILSGRDESLRCETCGAPIRNHRDILRSVRPYEEVFPDGA